MAAIENYIREDQGDIRLSVDGVAYFHSWSTYSGGDVTVSDAKARPGAMGDEVSCGGPATRNDITITISWSDLVLAQYSALENKCGNGKAKVSINYLDRNGVAIPGAVFSRTGTLKGVSDPNYDTNGNAVGVLTAVMSCDEKSA